MKSWLKRYRRVCLLSLIAITSWICYWYFYIYNPTTNIAYWPNGQIRHIYHNAYWVSHWEYTDYYENGQIYRIMHFKKWQQHWEFITYYENGQIADIGHWSHQKEDWEFAHYRPTWELRWKWNFIDWLPVDWEYIERYENGDIKRKITYKNWKVEGDDIWYNRDWEIEQIWNYDENWDIINIQKEWEKSVVEESEKVDNATVQYTPPVEEYISKSINTWKDYVQQLIDNFQWNIINWTDLESVNIEWDNTLYYNDRLWFAVILWEKWKWGRIKTKYTWREELSYKTSGGISFSKRNDNWWEYADMFWFTVFDKENYSKVESWWFWDREYFENETIWKNNKYNFVEFATNTSHDEIYDTFPTLDCKERMVQNYREIACDWYEEINWEYVKTWKSWIEQLFQDWFIFYDVK